jgi:hypothetical protein
MTPTRYLDAVEYDLTGRPGRLHAVASYHGQLWLATVCGLAMQAYPSTGTAWDALPVRLRCSRCAAALAESAQLT